MALFPGLVPNKLKYLYCVCLQLLRINFIVQNKFIPLKQFFQKRYLIVMGLLALQIDKI